MYPTACVSHCLCIPLLVCLTMCVSHPLSPPPSLQEACVIHDMASPTDYRKLAHHERGLYFVTPDRNALLHERFVELTNNQPVKPATVPVAMGRTLHVPHAGVCFCVVGFCACVCVLWVGCRWVVCAWVFWVWVFPTCRVGRNSTKCTYTHTQTNTYPHKNTQVVA